MFPLELGQRKTIVLQTDRDINLCPGSAEIHFTDAILSGRNVLMWPSVQEDLKRSIKPGISNIQCSFCTSLCPCISLLAWKMEVDFF